MKLIKATFWLALLCMLVACARTQTIENVASQPLPPGSEVLTIEQVEKAIIRAGNSRGWVFDDAGDGVLMAKYLPRTHMAEVRITFDTRQFSIHYSDSRNLMHDGDQIHRNYNRWVNNLRHDIIAEVTMITTQPD